MLLKNFKNTEFCQHNLPSFLAIKKKSENLDGYNLSKFIDDIKNILIQEGFSPDYKVFIIKDQCWNDIDYILQMEPTYESLEFVIEYAIDHLKKYHEEKINRDRNGRE